MRRRQTAAPESSVPARLRRFELADWVGRVPPEPATWAAGGHGMPWRGFKARRMWQDARRAWCAARGVSVLETFFMPVHDDQQREY